MIAFAFQGIFIFIACCGSSYLKNTRTYFIAANLAISIVGSLMIREIDAHQKWARFFGFCINMAFTANLPIILSMASSNVAGFTKKTTANSMVSWCPNSHVFDEKLIFGSSSCSSPIVLEM